MNSFLLRIDHQSQVKKGDKVIKIMVVLKSFYRVSTDRGDGGMLTSITLIGTPQMVKESLLPASVWCVFSLFYEYFWIKKTIESACIFEKLITEKFVCMGETDTTCRVKICLFTFFTQSWLTETFPWYRYWRGQAVHFGSQIVVLHTQFCNESVISCQRTV